MHRRDCLLILSCLVIGLAGLYLHDHPLFVTGGWAQTCTKSVSVSYAAHMVGLQARRLMAAAGRVVSIR